jgi:hypothetical protein
MRTIHLDIPRKNCFTGDDFLINKKLLFLKITSGDDQKLSQHTILRSVTIQLVDLLLLKVSLNYISLAISEIIRGQNGFEKKQLDDISGPKVIFFFTKCGIL